MTTDTRDYPEAPRGAPTATICENLAVFGAAPERGDLDSRVVWDEDEAVSALNEAIRIIVQGISLDGTQMEDEREPMLWGLVNWLHAQMQRLERSVDRIRPDMRELQDAQDGSEVKASELELLIDRARNLGDRQDAFEKMRDLAADAYRAETSDLWRPHRGSRTSRTRPDDTQAWIDARDFQRARKDREIAAHAPEGTLIAITGGKDVADPDTIWNALDRVLAKYPDMILVHGDAPGVEKLASRWAEARGVKQVVCKPNWEKYDRGAPYRRNEEIIRLMPRGVVAFPGSGITQNMIDLAKQAGIPIMEVAA